jgi:hypothetical protein
MQWTTDSKGADHATENGVRLTVAEMRESVPERRWYWSAGTVDFPSVTVSDFAPTREEAESFAIAAAPVVRTAAAEIALAVETVKARAAAGLRAVA